MLWDEKKFDEKECFFPFRVNEDGGVVERTVGCSS